jgi:UDP-galactopyranose mutase
VLVQNKDPQNSEEMALSRVGQQLYDLIFKPYTVKQWGKAPNELGPGVTARIPVRNNWDDRYFTDVFQALPTHGYTTMFQNIFQNPLIEVHTNVDFFDVRDTLKCGHTYFSGPIDDYFAHLGFDKLEYRSLSFTRKVVRDVGEDKYALPAPVVNYPANDFDFTRVVEYKHFLKQKSPHTVLFYEHSNDAGEP